MPFRCTGKENRVGGKKRNHNMKFQRTPDERFNDLEDYPFKANYLQIDDGEGGELRVHYVDEGSKGGPVVLLMHGQPSWSYLYRNMVPPLVEAGFRVVAPDLIGFGKSDKPTLIEDYSYASHITWMSEWLTALDLNDITLFCQDWGSLIGLRLVTTYSDRFSHVVLSNGGMPTGMVPAEYTAPLREAYKTLPVVKAEELGDRFRDTSGIPGFLYWRKFCAESAELEIGSLMALTSAFELSQSAEDAYRAPFPDQSYMAGARRFPSLVPLFHDEAEVEANKEAWKVLEKFDKPFMLAFSDNDPVTAGGDGIFMNKVPGCQGVAHRTIEKAGHFVQEDAPEQCVQAILDVIGK
jgi:haloalkane dehalogenase